MCLGCALLVLAPVRANAVSVPPPEWVRALADSQASALSGDAVILLDRTDVTFEPDGRMLESHRVAMRVRAPKAMERAVATAPYVTNESRVLDLNAWVIPSDGKSVSLARDAAADLDAAPNDVFHEARVLVLSPGSHMQVGALFAFESRIERRPAYLQFEYAFEGSLPTQKCQVALHLPAQWQAQVYRFGADSTAIVDEAGALQWSSRDREALTDEVAAPSQIQRAARLCISLTPAHPVSAASFSDWAQVGAWLAHLAAPQASADGALSAAASGAWGSSPTERGRIAAVGRLAQGVRYVSIQLGLGRGGGYQPRPATRVFANGFGDCKDKANLIAALIRANGGAAYLAATRPGDAQDVRADWPTPQQFDHCIVAVAVSDTLRAPAVIAHPKLGHLLFIDATDPYTPVGELPRADQGAYALLAWPEGGELVRLPEAPPEAEGTWREVEAELSADGALHGRVREVRRGEDAAALVAAIATRGAMAVSAELRDQAAAMFANATVGAPHVTSADDGAERVEYDLTLPTFAQRSSDGSLTMPRRLFACAIDKLPRVDARRCDVMLEADHVRERIALKLPAAYGLASVEPEPELREAAGEYRVSAVARAGVLEIDRELTIAARRLPASSYEDVRRFQGKVIRAEKALLLLSPLH